MTNILSGILMLIFMFLSGLHFYWGFGGRWGSSAVIPTRDDETKALMPGPLATFTVALGLLALAALVFLASIALDFQHPRWLQILHDYGLWVIAGLFGLRAVGDFNYVGFFKKIKHTPFGRNDTRYYSPLCLAVAAMALLLQVLK